MMQSFSSPAGATVSYVKYGSGPALVLVHGAFSDHDTNWEFVKPLLEQHFTVYAIARRGRGQTDATKGHSIDDESIDVATLIEAIDAPVFLLGHSHGAHVALAAAARVPERVRKLVLYEAPRPDSFVPNDIARLAAFGAAGDWDRLATTFFGEMLSVPQDELAAVRASALWPPILADAKASLHDLRALVRHEFEPNRFRDLAMPVLLQIGSESPRDFYATDGLAAVLPDARVQVLDDQAHEGMTTAPEMYAAQVIRFLLATEEVRAGARLAA
jgi:pimeloyl-ACP methyl ester carboxylesterase